MIDKYCIFLKNVVITSTQNLWEMRMCEHVFAGSCILILGFLKNKGSQVHAHVCAFISLCARVHTLWSNVCLRGRPCLTVKERVPGRACGRGRLWEMEGVKSSVWGICQRSVLDRGDHWDEKGGRAPGVERHRDYWGLGALTTGRMAAHHLQTHTHSHLSHCVLLTCPALQRLRAKPRVNKIVFLFGWKCALLCLQNNDMGNKSPALEPLQALKCRQLKENRVVRIKV